MATRRAAVGTGLCSVAGDAGIPTTRHTGERRAGARGGREDGAASRAPREGRVVKAAKAGGWVAAAEAEVRAMGLVTEEVAELEVAREAVGSAEGETARVTRAAATGGVTVERSLKLRR